jgi:hypothetical protein
VLKEPKEQIRELKGLLVTQVLKVLLVLRVEPQELRVRLVPKVPQVLKEPKGQIRVLKGLLVTQVLKEPQVLKEEPQVPKEQ